ncbi:HAD family hydrolase [Paenibacillus radicis (ex Xue et al. 2023)]|uniref:HAD family hydrolase n=1 Tax=Paenibacillus radicis (ex Xue et al. 2023) TaxID=2972489 RepID=A0ABT1YFE5_9BACL|nr:HAD family hydrolase [Paenibacillus radicis (ex Xue et al. 2023)]MCR8631912.1 HAD family hydrolase [Paenibacillus radicis (ex Xue et al. 2023)]
MIKAIIFDFDGLILDTETPEYESFQAMYRDHGMELTMDLWGLCIGTDASAFEPYSYLEQCLGTPIDRETARKLRRQRYSERMSEVQPRPGVIDYLREASELGLQIGLASSSTREWVTGYLKQFGLLDYFSCIRTRDDVEKVKPDPALYMQALSCLGVLPEEAIAFEDSPNGSLAAKRAGMHCVIVPNELTGQLRFGEHDLRLPSMSAMTLTEVISRVTAIT